MVEPQLPGIMAHFGFRISPCSSIHDLDPIVDVDLPAPFANGTRVAMNAELLRESVLHRYAQYCIVVRGRLLIAYTKQSVNIQDTQRQSHCLRETMKCSKCLNYNVLRLGARCDDSSTDQHRPQLSHARLTQLPIHVSFAGGAGTYEI